jgi:hypothetical protein
MRKQAAVLGIAACVAIAVGCCPAHRTAADGLTFVPLEGLGEGLPPEAVLPHGNAGPIYFDSLYIRTFVDRADGPVVAYVRFWATGQVLVRWRPGVIKAGEWVQPLATARDGDLAGDWLAGPPFPRSISPGEVGRFAIVGDDVLIEFFGLYDDAGPSFRVYCGKLTPDGFVLERVRDRRCLRGWRWKHISPWVFVRQQVGEMHGGPSW